MRLSQRHRDGPRASQGRRARPLTPPFWWGLLHTPHEGVPCLTTPQPPDPHLAPQLASQGPQAGPSRLLGCSHGLADASTPCTGPEAGSLGGSGAPRPAAPHPAGSWGRVWPQRPSGCAGSSAGRAGPARFRSPLPHVLPQLSDPRCVVYWGAVLVLDLCEICSGAPSSGLPRGRHSTNTPSAAWGHQDDVGPGHASAKAASQEGLGSPEPSGQGSRP